MCHQIIAGQIKNKQRKQNKNKQTNKKKNTGKSVIGNFESKAANFKFYACVTHESTDATDMAQLAISIRDTDNKHNATEEMVYFMPLKELNICMKR